jgi:tRNA A-37 threonylcarbamoyl transferase component Bud32
MAIQVLDKSKQRTVRIANNSFEVVNELPSETMELLIKIIAETGGNPHEIQSLIEDEFDYIGGGCFGRVFELTDDIVIKLNTGSANSNYNNRDGEVLAELQGIPIFPKLYMYSRDNRIIVMQKIKGKTVDDLSWANKGYKEQFKYELLKEELSRAISETKKRGWYITDAHRANCMFSEDGKFYVVDMGLFYREGEDRWGQGPSEVFETLDYLQKFLDEETYEKRQIEARKELREKRKKLRKQRMADRVINQKKNKKNFARAMFDSRCSLPHRYGWNKIDKALDRHNRLQWAEERERMRKELWGGTPISVAPKKPTSHFGFSAFM